ncbi:MAG: hypothetical protein IPQ07_14595, partial [Myxococcales bacterium]|nr:hypothetical protein [Myxococcales bacterium]
NVLASDTIPFAVWCDATRLGDYAGALGLRERGWEHRYDLRDRRWDHRHGAVGIEGIPPAWRASRDPLPAT